MRRTIGRGCARALIAPMPCADQAELLRAFDLPIALMQDAEALERIAAELVETKAADGVRYLEIRWGPLLHVAGGLALADGIAAVCAGPQDAARPDRDGRPAHRDGAALARPGGERRAGRDGGPVPRPRPDRLGPRRARGGLPRSPGPRRARSRRPGRAGCGSPSTPASGAAPPGAARARARSRADRARPGGDRRPGAVRRAHRARRDPRPVPDLELAGRDRALASRSTRSRACTAPACR